MDERLRRAPRTGIVLPAVLALSQDLGIAIVAFLGEHEGCGDLHGGLADATAETSVVWVSCSGCGAGLRRWFRIDEAFGSEGQ